MKDILDDLEAQGETYTIAGELPMLRLSFIAAALALGTGAAWADFDGQKVAAVYDDVRPACRQAELDGIGISPSENDRYCVILEALGDQLIANGWCWHKVEVEWHPCKPD